MVGRSADEARCELVAARVSDSAHTFTRGYLLFPIFATTLQHTSYTVRGAIDQATHVSPRSGGRL